MAQSFQKNNRFVIVDGHGNEQAPLKFAHAVCKGFPRAFRMRAKI